MLRDFFYLHRSDRRIILSLLVVVAVALAVVWMASPETSPSPSKGGERSPGPASTVLAGFPGQDTVPLFPFDPNTADSTELFRLGLSRFLVNNIYKYRARGGVFSTKADFARLYGLTVGQYQQLEPYITIATRYQPASTLFTVSPETSPNPSKGGELVAAGAAQGSPPLEGPGEARSVFHKLSLGETIDLQTADTTLLKRVPGIGSYFARRIVDYRQRLGGYVSLSQLDEIDGFPQQAKDYLVIDSDIVRRIDINVLSINELKRHPYVNFYQARAIADYRRQQGLITDLRQLQLLPDFPPEAIERLLPYVAY